MAKPWGTRLLAVVWGAEAQLWHGEWELQHWQEWGSVLGPLGSGWGACPVGYPLEGAGKDGQEDGTNLDHK